MQHEIIVQHVTGLSNNGSGVTYMLRGCPGYRWTPGHRGGDPPHCARCCKCAWCRGIRSALQTELVPCPRICDAGSLSPTPGTPSAPAGEHRAREESRVAAWSLSPGCAAQERLVKRLPATMQTTHRISDVFSFTHHTYCLLPACSFSFLCPFFSPALSLPPPTYSPLSEEQVRTAPCSFFVSLSSSNSCFSPSLFPFGCLSSTCYLLY